MAIVVSQGKSAQSQVPTGYGEAKKEKKFSIGLLDCQGPNHKLGKDEMGSGC